MLPLFGDNNWSRRVGVGSRPLLRTDGPRDGRSGHRNGDGQQSADPIRPMIALHVISPTAQEVPSGHSPSMSSYRLNRINRLSLFKLPNRQSLQCRDRASPDALIVHSSSQFSHKESQKRQRLPKRPALLMNRPGADADRLATNHAIITARCSTRASIASTVRTGVVALTPMIVAVADSPLNRSACRRR